jgi:hypothetical protein
MLTLIDGDNHTASREALFKLKQTKNVEIVELEGKKITLTDLIQNLEANSLFSLPKLVIIERLHSRQQSAAKKELLTYLKTYQGDAHVILWEDKTLTPTQAKAVNPKNHLQHKLSKSLFAFLDSLGSGNIKNTLSLLESSLKQDPAELVFFMIIRQVRLLLQAKTSSNLSMAPWQANKLKTQSGKFSLQKLQTLHHNLLQIDYDIKTGNTLLPLPQLLDNLVIKL